MWPASDPTGCLHAFEQRSNGIWIAAHELSQFALGQTFGIHFEQGPQNSELVRGDIDVGHATAKGLVEAVPGSPQQRRQAPARGRINFQLGPVCNR